MCVPVDGDIKRDIKDWVYKSRVENREYFNQDHTEKIERIEGKSYHKDSGRRLLSWSTTISPFVKPIFETIPEHYVEGARVRGQELMTNLERVFKDNITNLNDIAFSETIDKQMLSSLLQSYMKFNIKTAAVEKCFVNDKNMKYGYIDSIVKYRGVYFINEIKTRSKFEIRATDLLQLCFYNSITEGRFHLMLTIVNTKTAEVKHFRVPRYKKIVYMWNKFIELYSLSKDLLLEIPAELFKEENGK